MQGKNICHKKFLSLWLYYVFSLCSAVSVTFSMPGKGLLERNKFPQKILIKILLIHSIVSSDSGILLHLSPTGNDYMEVTNAQQTMFIWL